MKRYFWAFVICLVLSTFVFASNEVDTSFNPNITSNVSLLARQTDGKIVAIGTFAPTTENKVAKFNVDGTLDTSFNNSGSGFSNLPTSLAIQTDGKILAGGSFSSFNGTPKNNLLRINADGSLDTAFNPILDGEVKSIVALSNGKILVGGTFNSVNGTNRPRLARLNSDGTVDTAFNAQIVGTSINLIYAQTDGNFLITGLFSSVSGVTRNNYARLNADGTNDGTFLNIGGIGLAPATAITQQSDGKYYIAEFKPNQVPNTQIRRLNNNAELDQGFSQFVGFGGQVSAIHVQADSYVVFVGAFVDSFYRKNNVIRYRFDGLLDRQYMLVGANNTINALVQQPDGKLIIGGNFSRVENVIKSGLARINPVPTRPYVAPFDFDGDKKTDIAVVRPPNYFWYILNSSNPQNVSQIPFGASGDILAPADYNFDGKCDVGIFRQSNGQWWYQTPNGQHTLAAVWGQAGDKPIPSDWDGDGKSDFIVYRPSNGVWYRLSSGTGQMSFLQFGIAEDIPLQADFDGDLKSDVAVYRPSSGTWYWLNSSNGQFAGVPFGAVGDIPQTGDYDGDGKTDISVYRPSNGYWYFLFSYSDSGYAFGAFPFGMAGDKPIAADYDGDGRTDVAIFRNNFGLPINSGLTGWVINRSGNSVFSGQFGLNGDIPIPSAYYP